MISLVIETPRLNLRPLALDDVDVALDMFTDPDVSRYVCDVMPQEDIVACFPTWTRRCGDGTIGIWCVTDRATGEKYGTGVLLPLPVDVDDTEWNLLDGGGFPDREIEVGYILRKSAWGRGVAIETCRALLRFAFENTPLEAIMACTHPENDNSQHVLRKSGLRDVGPIRAYAEDGIPGFRISKDEWRAGGD